MTIPFYSVMAMIVVTYCCKLPLIAEMKKLGGYDNRNPRDQQAKLTGRGRRALSAHLNSFEMLSVFSICVFIAHLSGADARWSARLSVFFVVSRILYAYLYWIDRATLRSIVWFAGFSACFALGFLGAF